jgi:uncharacterized surface protein with fasciclin (FAS1) repeats
MATEQLLHSFEESQSMRGRLWTLIVGVFALTATVAACSSSSPSPSVSNTPSQPVVVAPSSSAQSSASGSVSASASAQAGAPFGSGCASLGVGALQLRAAAVLPVGVAAAAIPTLRNVVAAATAAGLVQTLNSAPALTVFTPNDTAFTKEPAQLVKNLLTNPAYKSQLVATLKYHVLGSKVTQDQLAGTHQTLEGKSLTITGSGDNFTINGTAKIICGGIQTKNAIVYVIDSVLHPPTS